MAAPAAFALLTVPLAVLGRIGIGEAICLTLSVLAAFLAGSFLNPESRRRRVAESTLLIPAAVLLFFSTPSHRLMLLPPLLFLANASAFWALRPFRDDRGEIPDRKFLAASAGSGLSIFLSTLLLQPGLDFSGLIHLLLSSLLSPGLLFLGPVGVFSGALFSALAPDLPVAGSLVVAIFLLWKRESLASLKSAGAFRQASAALLPLGGAFSLVMLALSPWGLPPPSMVFPQSSWLSWLGLGLILIFSLRFPPASAGAFAVLACLLLGPPIPPVFEGGTNLSLTQDHAEAGLPVGRDGAYVAEINLSGGEMLEEDTAAGLISYGKKRRPLRVGRDLAEESSISPGKFPAHTLPQHIVIRPPRKSGGPWRISGKLRFVVPAGVRPRISRKPGIESGAVLNVFAAGPEISSPSRQWIAEKWLWATAAALALFQLFSGLWRSGSGGIPWVFLTSGLIINRAAVQPLHLLGEGIGAYLSLAAIILVCLPAIFRWIQRPGRKNRSPSGDRKKTLPNARAPFNE